MRNSISTRLIGLGTFLLLAAGSTAAATFKVGNNADMTDAQPGDGLCSVVPNPPQPVDPALCTLRAALMEANTTTAHDTIVLAAGVTYLLTIPGREENGAATGDLDIRQPVTIRPPLFFGIPVGHARIDGQSLDRVFDVINVHGAGANFIGLEIVGGDIDQEFSKPGAGMNTSGSRITLSVLDITAEFGEGIHVGSGADMTASLEYSTVSGSPNRVAVSVANARLDIDSSSIVHSRTGIEAQQPTTRVEVRNSTISGNTNQGVLAYSGAQVFLVGSTVAGNTRGATVGQEPSLIAIERTLFAGNPSGSCAGDLNSGGFQMDDNTYDDSTCPFGGAGDESLFDMPAFLSLLGDHGGLTLTHRPMINSPALDRIDDANCSDEDFDQRLMPRAVAFKGGGAKCDVGAVELETDVIFFDQVDRL